MPRIMVIEDDADIRVALGQVLCSEGYEVQLCIDGRDAIDRLSRDPHPQAIVLDLMMPRLNGFGLLQVLSSEPAWSGIPVVVVSANPGLCAKALGVSCALQKPFELDELLAALHSIDGSPAPRLGESLAAAVARRAGDAREERRGGGVTPAQRE